MAAALDVAAATPAQYRGNGSPAMHPFFERNASKGSGSRPSAASSSTPTSQTTHLSFSTTPNTLAISGNRNEQDDVPTSPAIDEIPALDQDIAQRMEELQPSTTRLQDVLNADQGSSNKEVTILKAGADQPQRSRSDDPLDTGTKAAWLDLPADDGITTDMSPGILASAAQAQEHPTAQSKVEKGEGPAKLLQLRKDGKLGSPKHKTTGAANRVPKRGRPATTANAKILSKLLTLRYGINESTRKTIGSSIESILAGHGIPNSNDSIKSSIEPMSTQSTQTSVAVAEMAPDPHVAVPDVRVDVAGSSKPLHPFFTPQTRQSIGPDPSKSSATLATSDNARSTDAMSKAAAGQAVNKPSSKPSRTRGMWYSPWPDRLTAHVRGDAYKAKSRQNKTSASSGGKKAKGARPILTAEDEVLDPMRRLSYECRRGALQAFRNLRRPQRELRTCRDFQKVILRRLWSARSQMAPEPHPDLLHPASQDLYKRLADALIPFELFECEVDNWAHKYAPRCAAHVLQPPKTIYAFRHWLQRCAVNSTSHQPAANGISDLKTANKASKPRRKRRKIGELDDFIVSEDDEAGTSSYADCSGTLPEIDDTYSSLPRLCDDTDASTRAILITGGHGIGKSALIHAVAQELSYTVFEINAGTRRSGKDILDRVGDMTRNHLVNHRGASDTSISADAAVPATESNQKSVQSFFTAKTPAKGKTIQSRPQQKKPNEMRETPRSQKQSVILLEEVDLLFEEDRQFWTTVISLIADSKRPLVMTCNDENLVPCRDLPSTVILRLDCPPTQDVVEYLTLLAALEGHSLEPDSLQQLYRAHNQDLRATIADLNFRCQMGVGDPRYGLGWMLLSCDDGFRSADGERHRVISKDTFIMESVSGYEIESSDDPRQLPGNHIAKMTPTQLKLWLQHLDFACETLSALDILPSSQAHDPLKNVLDWTQPALSEKQRCNYTDGLQLLEAALRTPLHDITGELQDCSIELLQSAELRNDGADPLPADVSLWSDAPDPTAILEAQKQCANAHRKAFASFRQINDGGFGASNMRLGTGDWSYSSTCLDIAPFVRSIATSDERLEQQRQALSQLLSQGSRDGKRQRTTRASRAALEGGSKASTRRERYFRSEVDYGRILQTAPRSWTELAMQGLESTVNSTLESSTELLGPSSIDSLPSQAASDGAFAADELAQ